MEEDGTRSLPFAACKHFNAEANARLIAAAPDMLDALRRARSEIWRLLDVRGIEPKQASEWPEIVCADAAIRKATGEAA
jgi:hypothetical protein